MNEAFDDEKLYRNEQDFGSIEVNNYKEVLEKYNYDRYVQRFRLMAKGNQLKPELRPKLTKEQYDSLLQKLKEAFLKSGEKAFMKNEKSVKMAERLLIWSLFNEDYCGMGISNWQMGRTGSF